MLIQMVETELEKRRQADVYKGGFKGQSHFFGYLASCLNKNHHFDPGVTVICVHHDILALNYFAHLCGMLDVRMQTF